MCDVGNNDTCLLIDVTNNVGVCVDATIYVVQGFGILVIKTNYDNKSYLFKQMYNEFTEENAFSWYILVTARYCHIVPR